MKSTIGDTLQRFASGLQVPDLNPDIERLIGQAVALAGSAAVALGTFERQAPRTAKRLNKDLLKTLDGASRSTGKLFKATRRYLRKHPWQSAALVGAAAVVSAVAAANDPGRRRSRETLARPGPARAKASTPKARGNGGRIHITTPARDP